MVFALKKARNNFLNKGIAIYSNSYTSLQKEETKRQIRQRKPRDIPSTPEENSMLMVIKSYFSTINVNHMDHMDLVIVSKFCF